MSKRRPFGGGFFIKTKSVWRTELEKRGPMGTQSNVFLRNALLVIPCYIINKNNEKKKTHQANAQ